MMNKDQAAAYVFAQSVAALAEIEGMKAANAERMSRGEALAYNEAAFFKIHAQYGIHHNAVMILYEGCE